MKISQLMRLGSVTRFHMVRTLRRQTVAEHSYRVWLLSEEFMRRIGIPENCNGWLNVSRLALMHDAPESEVGDTATPYKNRMKKILTVSGQSDSAMSPPKAVEHGIYHEIDELETAMREDHLELVVLVKTADLLESAIFLAHEGIGPHEQRLAESLLDDCLVVAESHDSLVEEKSKTLGRLSHYAGQASLRDIASKIFMECTS